MFVLIVYDSLYGNTAEIARVLAAEADKDHEVKVVPITKATPADVMNADLLLMGSPTQGGRPTPAMQQYIRDLLPSWLEDKQLGVFDTRFSAHGHGPLPRLLMRILGFAAPRMSAALTGKGAVLVMPPQGFMVTSKKGPLGSSEVERAKRWMRQLLVAAPG